MQKNTRNHTHRVVIPLQINILNNSVWLCFLSGLVVIPLQINILNNTNFDAGKPRPVVIPLQINILNNITINHRVW